MKIYVNSGHDGEYSHINVSFWSMVKVYMALQAMTFLLFMVGWFLLGAALVAIEFMLMI